MTIRKFTDQEYAALPMTWALILREHVIDLKPYQDIAIAHDIPVGTVKSRISRSRTKIAKLRAAAAPQSTAA